MMTAIFAYSSPLVPFFAGDTLRADRCAILPSTATASLHFWNDRAVFGQVGTKRQSEMIGDIKARKQQCSDSTDSTFFDDSEKWLHKTFLVARPSHHAAAVAKNSKNLLNKGLLVAFVCDSGVASGLARYEFSTGDRVDLTSEGAADG